MAIRVTVNAEEVCQLAGIPYDQTYKYEGDEGDDANYFEIHRTGEYFSIECFFQSGWRPEAFELRELFKQLCEDYDLMNDAYRKIVDKKIKAGDGFYTCHQAATVFECDNFVVTIRKQGYPTHDDKPVYLATVENTENKDQSIHPVSEMSAAAASAAIKLHLARAAEIAEEKA